MPKQHARDVLYVKTVHKVRTISAQSPSAGWLRPRTGQEDIKTRKKPSKHKKKPFKRLQSDIDLGKAGIEVRKTVRKRRRTAAEWQQIAEKEGNHRKKSNERPQFYRRSVLGCQRGRRRSDATRIYTAACAQELRAQNEKPQKSDGHFC